MTLGELLSAVPLQAEVSTRKPRQYWRRWASEIRRVPLELLERSAWEIERRDILELQVQLKERWAPGTASETLLAVKTAYNMAVAAGLTATNPCAGVHLDPSARLEEYLQAEQVEALLQASREHRPDLLAPIALGIYAGLRRGEMAALRWRHVDLRRKRLRVELSWDGWEDGPPKNGESATLPIAEPLHEILSWWQTCCPKTAEDLVCPRTRADGSRHAEQIHGSRWLAGDMRDIRDLYEFAGIPQAQRPWHCLRHTLGARGATTSGKMPLVQQLMRHKDIKSTMIYLHWCERDLEQVAEAAAQGKPLNSLSDDDIDRIAQRVADLLRKGK